MLKIGKEYRTKRGDKKCWWTIIAQEGDYFIGVNRVKSPPYVMPFDAKGRLIASNVCEADHLLVPSEIDFTWTDLVGLVGKKVVTKCSSIKYVFIVVSCQIHDDTGEFTVVFGCGGQFRCTMKEFEESYKILSD